MIENLADPITEECAVGEFGLRWNIGPTIYNPAFENILEQPWRCRQAGKQWIVWKPIPTVKEPS